MSLNFMYLPVFVGMNAALIKQIESELGPHVIGKELTEDLLDKLHEQVLDRICKQFAGVDGLFDYLDGIKFIR